MNITKALEPIIMAKFRTFGGGQDSKYNPVAHALKDDPLTFAAGVSVRDVINTIGDFVCKAVIKEAEKKLRGH